MYFCKYMYMINCECRTFVKTGIDLPDGKTSSTESACSLNVVVLITKKNKAKTNKLIASETYFSSYDFLTMFVFGVSFRKKLKSYLYTKVYSP